MGKEIKELSAQQNNIKIASDKFLGNITGALHNAFGSDAIMTERQQQLGRHLFLKITETLNVKEKERISKGGKDAPYTWNNVDQRGLTMAAYSMVRLGVDALVDDHVYIIPYFNGHKKLYDLDIRLGYMWCDSAEPDRIVTWSRKGYRARGVEKEPGCVNASIDWLKRRRIYIHPQCVNTIRCGEIRTHREKKILSQWLSPSQTGYQDGHLVPIGAQSKTRRLYPFLCY